MKSKRRRAHSLEQSYRGGIHEEGVRDRGPRRRSAEALVVATRQGGPISASNLLSREFYPALERCGLPRVVFHS